ncbi:MAG: hypothetical protein IJF15_00675 [Oscillospiraceae bacterium]|nr:hypothetical protein [Oscillospiraceae bacterium]
MKNQRLMPYYIGFGVLIVLVLAILALNTFRATPQITLPAPPDALEQGGSDAAVDDGAYTRLSVTPETVQGVVETLARPKTYSRTILSETFWSGGSATSEIVVNVDGAYTSIAATLPDGTLRRTLTDGVRSCIWYGGSNRYFSAAAGDISADEEQGIPTYEEVIDLPTERIAAADYRMLSDVDCIYVETSPDELGYCERYWISVETGLLAAAEKLLGENTVYRMASLGMSETVAPDAFFLPDGTPFAQTETTTE